MFLRATKRKKDGKEHCYWSLVENGKPCQMRLFPEDRAPKTDEGDVVRIRMDRLTVRNLRNWGEAWLGTVLWDRLGLDDSKSSDALLLRCSDAEGSQDRAAVLTEYSQDPSPG